MLGISLKGLLRTRAKSLLLEVLLTDKVRWELTDALQEVIKPLELDAQIGRAILVQVVSVTQQEIRKLVEEL